VSDNNSSTSPHAHLIGAQVTIQPEIKKELKIDWDDGVITCCFDTARGVGIHICNPETGDITDALTLAGVKFQRKAIRIVVETGNLTSKMLAHTQDMLEKMINEGF